MKPGSSDYLAAQRADLLRFGAGSRRDLGFGYLDESGGLDPTKPVELYITCRMTHVFSLGLLADEPPRAGGPDREAMRELATHGIRALLGPLRDDTHGGWYAAVGDEGFAPTKQAYGHAFVVLAASSARAAGIEAATELLTEALDVQNRYFWDETAGLVVEEWDRTWNTLEPYRGVNSNMHTVEAYLAAGDVTGEHTWHHRAGRIGSKVAAWAADNAWRIPEHFDSEWVPMLEHHKDKAADPFRPYGATVGHGFEWARLLVAIDATLGDEAPPGLVAAAVALNDRAVSDGWATDGSEGFIYTTDWSGRPVVRTRMHWVLAEAVSTATVLHRVTGNQRFADDVARWWAYADKHLVDHERGSWHHELDATNTPAASTWQGKPDIYHAYQAALLPEIPTTPSFASALAARTN